MRIRTRKPVAAHALRLEHRALRMKAQPVSSMEFGSHLAHADGNRTLCGLLSESTRWSHRLLGPTESPHPSCLACSRALKTDERYVLHLAGRLTPPELAVLRALDHHESTRSTAARESAWRALHLLAYDVSQLTSEVRRHVQALHDLGLAVLAPAQRKTRDHRPAPARASVTPLGSSTARLRVGQ